MIPSLEVAAAMNVATTAGSNFGAWTVWLR
jgi:hypothetical protein